VATEKLPFLDNFGFKYHGTAQSSLLQHSSTLWLHSDLTELKSLTPYVCPLLLIANSNSRPLQRPEPRAAPSDGMWLHDKAPGVPRAANGLAKPEASINSKLLVSNLHYEITPKDLIVRPAYPV